VTILSPDQIFSKGSTKIEIDREVKNLILAINFSLKRACVSLASSSVSNITIVPKADPNVSVGRVIKNGPETQINIRHSFSIQSYATKAVVGNETFDEIEILRIFKIIQGFSLFHFSYVSNQMAISKSNIEHALREYTGAMKATDRLSKFKQLYNSLEFAVNSDGNEVIGEDFKKEVMRLTNKSEQTITKWHQLYMRSKHVSRESIEIRTFLQGERDISTIIPELKIACQEVILKKL
jgi:hypothetical protein